MLTSLSIFCALFSISLGIFQIMMHLMHYYSPYIQAQVCRIILLVPVYSVFSMISILHSNHLLFCSIAKDLYEAYVVYIFTSLIISYLGGEDNAVVYFINKKNQTLAWPFHKLPKIHLSKQAFRTIKIGVLQTIVLKPLTSLAALFLDGIDLYDEGHLNFEKGYPYIWILDNISMLVSVYSLALLYKICKSQLRHKIVSKFLCVKGLIFFLYWQSSLIAVLVRIGAINGISIEELQNKLLCLDMFVASILYWNCFHHREHRISQIEPYGIKEGVQHIVSLKDVFEDAKNTFFTDDESVNYQDYSWDFVRL